MTEFKTLFNETVIEDLDYAFIAELECDDLQVNKKFDLDPNSITTFLPTDDVAIEFVNNEISLKDNILVDSINSKNGTTVSIEGTVFENDTLPKISTDLLDVNTLLRTNLITDISLNGVNVDGVVLIDGKVHTDQIDELTSNAGVLIEQNLLKDNTITTNLLNTDVINEKTSGVGITIDSVILKDNTVDAFIIFTSIVSVNNNILVDVINEKTAGVGISVDSVLLRDNTVTANTITANTEIITDVISGTSDVQIQNNTTVNENQIIIDSPIAANICINSDSNNNDTTDSGLFLQTNAGAIASGVSQTATECKFNTSRTAHVFYTDDIVFPIGNCPPTYLVENERARINSTGLVLPAGKKIQSDVIDSVGGLGIDIETVNIDQGDITNATLDGIDYSSMTQIQLDYLIALNVVSTSSTYVPVVTLISNLDTASISGTTRYTRQGDHVTVWMSVITNNTASGTFSLRVSLPIASTLGQQHDLTGTGWDFPNILTHVGIRGDTGNNEAFITGQSTLLFNKTYQCSFTYLVL